MVLVCERVAQKLEEGTVVLQILIRNRNGDGDRMDCMMPELSDDFLPRVSSIRCGDPGCHFLCNFCLLFHFLLFCADPRNFAHQMESLRLALGIWNVNGRCAAGRRGWIHGRVDASRWRRRRRRRRLHAVNGRRRRIRLRSRDLLQDLF